MKTTPIRPAQIESAELPRAPETDDGCDPRVGAFDRARHVFLAGNGLPARWAGRADFTVVETGFGLGDNFLATWQAWRDDPGRCERLHFVAVERRPPRRDDLVRAHAHSPAPELAQALIDAWPPLTPNLHALDFDAGRVRLLLALGDITALLPLLRAQADAFYLDGLTPARSPEMQQSRVFKALARLARPQATVATVATLATLATPGVARELREGLVTAGFELQRAPGGSGEFEITLGRFEPRFTPRHAPHLGVQHQAPRGDATEAIVIGAGIAGACTAAALAALGVHVHVLDRHAEPAAESSGQAAGLFHGTVHADDGPHARLFRAAALAASRCYPASGADRGLLRLAQDLPRMQSLLATQGLPADYVQALAPEAASLRSGVELAAPAWFYPGGGWVWPGQEIGRLLAAPKVRFSGGVNVAQLQRDGNQWLLLDAAGAPLARTPIVVLANAGGAAPLLQRLGHAPWPLTRSRGQVTRSPMPAKAALPQLALAGDGYAMALPDGSVLFGATHEAEHDGASAAEVRSADRELNLMRLKRLTGIAVDPAACTDRAGWRLHSADRMPIAGALPLAQMPPGQRLDQARLLPRDAGLFVITALGGRGLTLAPLLGRLVAAMATATPWPLEQDLVDAIDPGRWVVRAARQGAAGAGPSAQD